MNEMHAFLLQQLKAVENESELNSNTYHKAIKDGLDALVQTGQTVPFTDAIDLGETLYLLAVSRHVRSLNRDVLLTIVSSDYPDEHIRLNLLHG